MELQVRDQLPPNKAKKTKRGTKPKKPTMDQRLEKLEDMIYQLMQLQMQSQGQPLALVSPLLSLGPVGCDSMREQ